MTPRRIAIALGTIVVLATGFTLAFAFPQVFAPPPAPIPIEAGIYSPLALTPAEVKVRQDRGERILLADVRGKSSFEEKHIAGARAMPASESKTWGPRLDPAELVVFYCSCPDEGSSTGTARIAEESYGFKNVAVLKGGLKAWESAGYPITKR